jgi:hypothetical protein
MVTLACDAAGRACGIWTRRVTAGILAWSGTMRQTPTFGCRRWRDVADCWIHRDQPGRLDADSTDFLPLVIWSGLGGIQPVSVMLGV